MQDNDIFYLYWLLDVVSSISISKTKWTQLLHRKWYGRLCCFEIGQFTPMEESIRKLGLEYAGTMTFYDIL